MSPKKVLQKKKKGVRNTAPVKLSKRDNKTISNLQTLADTVVVAATKIRDPHVDIPSRTLSNVRYSPRKGILEMGRNKREGLVNKFAASRSETSLAASENKTIECGS